MQGIWFCPRCHRRVGLPKGMEKANIKGNLNISCGYCKKGKVIIKGQPDENPDKVIENPVPIEQEFEDKKEE